MNLGESAGGGLEQALDSSKDVSEQAKRDLANGPERFDPSTCVSVAISPQIHRRGPPANSEAGGIWESLSP